MSLSPFGRDSQRGQRRRRLLAEECATLAGGVVAVASGERIALPPPQKTDHYGDAEFLRGEPSLLDLVPRRPLAFVFLFLAGAGLIAAVECLYAWMPALSAALRRPGRIAAFELGEPGSLGTWIASLELLAAAGIALLVYRVRRHRNDDYHGRYRVWLWATMCWFLLAADLSTGLRGGFRDAMILATGARVAGDGSIWWAIAYALLFGSIGTRLLMDMWPCRLSTAALGLAACGYVAAAPAHFGWWSFGAGVRGVLIEQGTLMSSHLLALLAMAIQARYVLLDAEGLLPRRLVEAGEGPAVSHSEGKGSGSWIAVDAAHDPSPPVIRRPASAGAGSAGARLEGGISPVSCVSPGKANATQPSAESKLSKAERKALRNRLLQERLQRQQQSRSNWGS